MAQRSKIDDPAMLKAIKARWFSGSGNIAVGAIEGVNHDAENGVVTFGYRKLHDASVSELIHQMCHFIEIDEERAAEDGFGLIYGTTAVSSSNQIVTKPRTTQASHREARVIAWQMTVMEALGMKPDLTQIVAPMREMHDFDLHDRRKQVMGFATALVEKYAEGLSIAQFDALWSERVALLPELFERRLRKEQMIEDFCESEDWEVEREVVLRPLTLGDFCDPVDEDDENFDEDDVIEPDFTVVWKELKNPDGGPNLHEIFVAFDSHETDSQFTTDRRRARSLAYGLASEAIAETIVDDVTLNDDLPREAPAP